MMSNGARETLLRFLTPGQTDLLLITLWLEGFKIVPLDQEDVEQEPLEFSLSSLLAPDMKH